MGENQQPETAENEPVRTSRSGVLHLDGERIQGAFSTQTVTKVGTGTTQRRTIQKTYWYVEQGKGDVILVQALNESYVPSGPKREMARDDFLAKFNPEPEFYQQTVFPKIRELDQTIVRGEQHREAGRSYSAEFEFKTATAVDEENVRANFGLGLTYLDRGETEKANDIFERLVELDAAFEAEHKHLFNDFGINLRKNKMLDQALDYYLKAESLVQNDENLFHNIARVYFEKGELPKCVEYLDRALVINPEMEEAGRFKDYLTKQGYLKNSGNGVEIVEPETKKPSGPINVDGDVEF